MMKKMMVIVRMAAMLPLLIEREMREYVMVLSLLLVTGTDLDEDALDACGAAASSKCQPNK
jgi:hypothetical protein